MKASTLARSFSGGEPTLAPTSPAWIAAALLLALGCGEPAEPTPAATSAPGSSGVAGRLAELSPGRNWFEAYCTECHGQSGRGDGPAAEQTQPRPADLTRIAARRGRFDAQEVAAFIDGRLAVESHGPRDMPVWGRKKVDRAEPAYEEELHLDPRMIDEVVAYLETLQVP